jgi:hypothetical protein
MKGPVEALAARLEAIEQRAGITVARPAPRREREGRPGPGARWLLARLGTEHPERLDRFEEDCLGHSILAQDCNDLVEAQRLLDLLAEHHKTRLELRARSDESERDEATNR